MICLVQHYYIYGDQDTAKSHAFDEEDENDEDDLLEQGIIDQFPVTLVRWCAYTTCCSSISLNL